MSCPQAEKLFVRPPSIDVLAHLAGCPACRGIAELGQGRTHPALSCDGVEPLLAGRMFAPLATGAEAVVSQHLATCAACHELAEDLDTGSLEDELRDIGALPICDFDGLHQVAEDNYVRGKVIGRGGMGRIVRARDRRLGRAVAIKELLDERLRERFEREARLTARLEHPAIVNVHEAGRWSDGKPFYAMKYVAGQPLDRLIAEKKTLAERLTLLPNLVTVVEAIAYAHSQRVIHRDLKPQNILVGAFGETVVIDWGLAKNLVGDDAPADLYRPGVDVVGLTQGGAGTPQYMPPEQAQGEHPDERVDVYALGATLYHVLAGAPPFTEMGPLTLLERARTVGPRALVEIEPGVPRALQAIVVKAMSARRESRYATAGALAEELKRFQNGQLVSAYHYSLGEQLWRVVTRHRAVVTLVAGFTALLAVVGGLSVQRIVAARERAEKQLAELLTERGRAELSAGAPSRALVYLAEAMSHGADGPVVRSLVAQAARPAEALAASLVLGERPGLASRVSPDGTRVLAITGQRQTASLWSIPDRGSLGPLGADIELRDVTDTGFSPRGDLFFTAATCDALEATYAQCDKVVYVWTTKDGVRVRSLSHADVLAWVGFAGEDHVVTLAGRDLYLWQTTSGAATVIRVDAAKDTPVAVAPDASQAVIFGADGACRLWDLHTGQPRVQLAVGAGRPTAALFDPEGARVVVATDGDDARVFLAESGAEVARLPRLRGGVHDLALSRDGKYLLGVRDGDAGALLWRLDTGEARLLPHPATVTRARFNPTGTNVLTLGNDGAVRLWSLDGGLLASFDAHVGAIVDGGFTSDAAQVVTAGEDGMVKVWRVSAAQRFVDIPAGRPASASFDDHGRLLTIGRDGAAQVWLAQSGKRLASLPPVIGNWAAPRRRIGRFTRDGQRVLFGDAGGAIDELTLATGALTRLRQHTSDSRETFDMTADGSRFLERDGDSSRVLDGQGTRVATINGIHLGIAPDGRRVVGLGGSNRSSLSMWDLETGKLLLSGYYAYDPADFPGDIAVAPQGDTVTTTLESGGLSISDLATGNRVADIMENDVRGFSYSPDGTRLLTYGARPRASVWRTSDARLLSGFPDLTGSITQAVWSPDGERIFIGGSDGSARIWDSASGQTLATLTSFAQPVDLAVFSPGGAWILVSAGGQTRLFDVGIEDRAAAPVAELAARAPFGLEAGHLVPRYLGFDTRPVTPELTRADRHFRAGSALLLAGRYQEAVDQFSAVAALTSWPRAMFYLGVAYAGASDPTRALQAFERYAKAAPEAGTRAEVTQRVAQLKATGIIAMSDELARSIYATGAAAFDRGQYADAAAQLEIAFGALPLPILAYDAAQAHEQAGNTAAATTFYRKYLELYPVASDRKDVERRLAGLSR